MKAWVDELINDKAELAIAPLIDVVFLLLIYFMVTATLKRAEADLNMALPGKVPPSTAIEMPDEQMIEVLADGMILLNNKKFPPGNDDSLVDLEYTLLRYQQASLISKTKALITISADDDSQHDRVVDVLNACAGAGITNVTFGSSQ